MTDDERQDAYVILTKLSGYFIPKRNKIYERYLFNSRSQKVDESFHQFLTTLRKLRHMWVRSVWGRNTPRSYRHWLTRPWTPRTSSSRIYSNPTKTAIDICRTNEIAASQRHKMEEHSRREETWSTREHTKKSTSHAPVQILWWHSCSRKLPRLWQNVLKMKQEKSHS